jgi:predicted regulator of Ras-like GTPase activity (Roadblock/LC7/MglB family)
MNDLAQIARIPNVASAVLGDASGVFHDAVREPDGEAVAAVTGFIASSVADAGEQLGLGALSRISVAGATRACVVLVRGASVLTIGVEPPGTLPTVERALDSTSGVRG